MSGRTLCSGRNGEARFYPWRRAPRFFEGALRPVTGPKGVCLSGKQLREDRSNMRDRTAGFCSNELFADGGYSRMPWRPIRRSDWAIGVPTRGKLRRHRQSVDRWRDSIPPSARLNRRSSLVGRTSPVAARPCRRNLCRLLKTSSCRTSPPPLHCRCRPLRATSAVVTAALAPSPVRPRCVLPGCGGGFARAVFKTLHALTSRSPTRTNPSSSLTRRIKPSSV
jgi:hypothetical protein